MRIILHWHDLLRFCVWGLLSRPARTSALVVCLATGVTAAVFVGVVISGFSQQIDRLAFGAYSRALIVRENGLIIDRYGPPTLDDRRKIEREVVEIQSSAAWISGRVPFHRDGELREFRVYGVAGDFEPELDSPIVAGRSLTVAETASASRVCLLGAEVSLMMGGAVQALNQSVRLNGMDCLVVGVLGEPRSRPAASYAEGIIAPFAAAQRYFITEDAYGPAQAERLTFFVKEPDRLQASQFSIDRMLRKEYGVPQSRPSPFVYGDRNVSLDQMLEQRRMLSRLLMTLASLSIATSLIAFGTLSVASMIARRREIAVRMTLGAFDTDIQLQMMLENVCTGVLGGGLGVVLGVVLGYLASQLWTWPFAIDFSLAAVIFTLAASTGLLSGLWAANRVARMSPSLAAKS